MSRQKDFEEKLMSYEKDREASKKTFTPLHVINITYGVWCRLPVMPVPGMIPTAFSWWIHTGTRYGTVGP